MMSTVDTHAKIVTLFEQAGHAHHKAYEDVNGHHPEWALWYAEYLAKKLSTVLKIDLTPAVLGAKLAEFETQRQTHAPDSNWADFYAAELQNTYSI